MEQSKKALLVMDFQNAIVNRITDAASLLVNTSNAINRAREGSIPVIYVIVGFRQGMPEISSANKSFSATMQHMANADMEEWMTIHPGVAPKENDIVITKRRISAFTGSDLEVVLRGLDIRDLILTGVSTSGVVLSTLREAADKDYGLTVIADCCADPDEEVHRVLTGKVFPRQADVIKVKDWPK
ncbi:MAG TPA: isochorismatase family cysteine hydrolase [Edaphocola sp.]|nr:isochorismatase family cysteine hydrolase [Edaphocola sp.]